MPSKMPHQPTLELIREVISSHHKFGPLRGSNLPKPKSFIEAVRRYEAARYLDRLELAEEAARIIREHIEEDYISNDEIVEFLRRMPRKDILKTTLAKDLAEQMAINDDEGDSNAALTEGLAKFPEFLKDVKRHYNKLTSGPRNDKFVEAQWDN